MHHFILWVKMMGIGIIDQAQFKIQFVLIYIDCMHPKTALRSSTSQSGVSHRCHLLTLPFLCPYFRAGSNASAATQLLCLMCTDNRKVSTRGREDALAAHVGVISG